MHASPVKRGLVQHPREWPWSSWGQYALGEKRSGWIPWRCRYRTELRQRRNVKTRTLENRKAPPKGVSAIQACAAHLDVAEERWLQPVTKYALTRICSVKYIQDMERAFEIVAEPNRRAILGLLVTSQQSVGEIERQLGMPQPTVSKHLRVLREAGFVESTVDAQRRLYRLKPEPFQEMDAWLDQFRRFWSPHLDALERHLDQMEQSTRKSPASATKRKTKKQRDPGRGRNQGESK
jgi:DNA-binding transcriptional ArsR family regulator